MVNYQSFTLANGLRVIVHHDNTTPLVVVNMLYDVGSRDDLPNKTGTAHLFEHLMFSGSKNVPNYDEALHRAGGECNAFTSPDLTNYYNVIPASNIATALWLESDRMKQLILNKELLQVQKQVVIEEFKECYINQPYGDSRHQIRKLCYKKHPYQWPVIGKDIDQIARIELEDAHQFYRNYYTPKNAILSIAGGVSAKEARPLVEEWFGDIINTNDFKRNLPKDDPQKEFRCVHLERNVSADAIFMAFHICNRLHPDFHTVDLIGELLDDGRSSRMYKQLVKEQEVFSQINCYVYGDYDDGLFFIEGKLNEDVSIAVGEQAIWAELQKLQETPISQNELQKVMNKIEASIIFSETSHTSKAFLLAQFDLLGNIDEINTEISRYIHITPADIMQQAQKIFNKNNCSAVYYHRKE